MLELVDLKKRISKEEYREVFPELEIRLGQCQRDARRAGVPVIIAFEGWEAAGKGTVINRLTQALDPRGFKVHPINAPDEAESLRPWLWRFWRALPAAGTFALFDRSWYGRVLVERVTRMTRKKQWQQAYGEIQQFERQLADSGVVLVKFWLHIGKGEQKRRFKRIEKNAATSWKIGKEERKQQRNHEKWLAAVEEMLERTSTANAPWTVIEASQARHARVKVFETVIHAVRNELDRRASEPQKKPKPMPAPKTSPRRKRTVLSRLDLSVSLDREAYEKRLDELQERLFSLEHELYVARVPAIIVFEGWDAAGKGGIIKRLTRGLDPRGYEVVPVAAPSDEEKARHYLWRFWRHLPKAGHVTIFDRS
ncbi:MAG: phosphate--AMP phosphotransferase, partial [Lentisphaerae bacterium]|nr:phosphate--AMP phosphotransferase [Lentisphaerota bacterium]